MNAQDVAKFAIGTVRELARDNFVLDYMDRELEREGYRGRVTENLVNFVLDGVELEAKRTRKSIEVIIEDLTIMFSAAKLNEDSRANRELSRAEMADVADLARDAVDLSRDLEELNDRGRGRDRDDRGRGDFQRGSFGRQDSRRERSSGSSFSRQSSRDSRRDDRDDSRGYREGSGSYRRGDMGRGRQEETRRRDREELPEVPNSQDAVLIAWMQKEKVRLEREREENEARRSRQEDRHQRPAPPRREFNEAVEERRPAQVEPKVEFERVTPDTITERPVWKGKSAIANDKGTIPTDIGTFGVSSKGNILPSPDRPITLHEIEKGCYDFTDTEVLENVPERPAFTFNGATPVWEADEVAPQWGFDANGYRVLSYRKLTEEEKDVLRKEIHVMPEILGAKAGINSLHPQRTDILGSVANPQRFNVESARKREAEARGLWNEEVARLKAENEESPEEELVLPEFVEEDFQNVDNATVTVPKAIYGFGHEGLASAIMDVQTEMADELEGRNAEFVASNYISVMETHSGEVANELLEGLRGLVITNSPVSNVTLPQMLKSLENRQDSLPAPIVVAAKRHIVNVVNEILTVDMGSTLTISEVGDLKTIEVDMAKLAGSSFTEQFVSLINKEMRRFETFTTGEQIGKPGRILQESKGVVLVMPIARTDLNLKARPKMKTQNTAVTRESSPKLYSALNAMAVVHGRVRKEMLLADGTWISVSVDAMNKEQHTFILTYTENN